MYSHYFVTAFGINNPFKKFITQAQLIQFAMCIVHALCVLGFEVVLPRPYAWAQFVYHIQVRPLKPPALLSRPWHNPLPPLSVQMLVLFGHFYRKSYLAARSAKRQASGAKPETATAAAAGGAAPAAESAEAK